MLKFIGTLSFLIFIFCFVMLIVSVFNRRINTKIWIISVISALVVLITCYYVDVAVSNDIERTNEIVEQYYD